MTNVDHDRNQLANTVEIAKTAMGVYELDAIPDRGYFSSEEIRKSHEKGITPIVPKCTTYGVKADGRFDKSDFIYDKEKNEYHCPAGQSLIWRFAPLSPNVHPIILVGLAAGNMKRFSMP